MDTGQGYFREPREPFFFRIETLAESLLVGIGAGISAGFGALSVLLPAESGCWGPIIACGDDACTWNDTTSARRFLSDF
jgi:hypothetical protein